MKTQIKGRPSRARTHTRPHPADEVIKAYSSPALRAYLWFRAHADEQGILEFQAFEFRQALGYRYRYGHAVPRLITELALGHPPVAPLIEILCCKRGCGPTKIRILGGW